MKSVYVAFLAPTNRMGSLVRFFTKNSYSHTAVSLNGSLDEMYSFARKKERPVLAGGFVTEYPTRYLSCRGDIPLKIAEVSLDDNQFLRLSSIIEDFMNRKNEMIYNTIDAVISSIFRKPIPIKDCYTCLTFTCHVLGLKNIKNIHELEERLTGEVIYEGSYREYVTEPACSDPAYFESLGFPKIFFLTMRHFGRLFRRYFKDYFLLY